MIKKGCSNPDKSAKSKQSMVSHDHISKNENVWDKSPADARAWLETRSNHVLVFDTVQKLASSGGPESVLWLRTWLRKRPEVEPVLAMLETIPDEETIAFAKDLARADTPDPRLGMIIELLLRVSPDPETLRLTENWLYIHPFAEDAKNIALLLLSEKNVYH